MDFSSWLFFLTVWFAASLPLGPNAVNCINASATYGFRNSLWSVLGVFLAANVHMLLALSGIATFINTYPIAFEILRWLGVAYLCWMGVSLFKASSLTELQKRHAPFSKWSSARRAFLISMSNPKAIFAWLAVFTQFINPSEALASQLIALAPTALAVNLIVYTGYCAVGLGVNRLFIGNRKQWFDRITSGLYLLFALLLGAGDLRKA